MILAHAGKVRQHATMSLALVRDVVTNGPQAGRCPLCGTSFEVEPATTEHIVPQWLQERFGLRGLFYAIPSQLQKRYTSATFPACRRCNNEHFAGIEDQVLSLVDGDASADDVRYGGWMDRVAIWAAKLLWLMALKSNAGVDHRAAAAGEPAPILDDVFIDGLQLTHMILRAETAETAIASWPFRRPFMAEMASAPYSAYVFEIDTSDERFGAFDYIDNPGCCGIALRVGRLGFVCVFDGGHHARQLQYRVSKLYEHALHPLQFQEAVARIFYDQTCLRPEAEALTYFWNEVARMIVVTTDVGDGQAYGEELHDPARLAEFLGRYTFHDPRDMVSADGARNWTSLFDDQGVFQRVAITDDEIAAARADPEKIVLPIDAAWRRPRDA